MTAGGLCAVRVYAARFLFVFRDVPPVIAHTGTLSRRSADAIADGRSALMARSSTHLQRSTANVRVDSDSGTRDFDANLISGPMDRCVHRLVIACPLTKMGTCISNTRQDQKFMATPDSGAVQPSIMNVPLSFPCSATQLPLELLDIISKYLCAEDGYGCSNDRSFFYAALCPCSLVSRRWATHIRPTLFERVVLTSKEKACTFLALLRSPVVVPVLLREVVREIKLEMDEDSRLWMYHVWEILRDGVLPNLESVDLKIKGNEESPKGSQPKKGRSRCETLLDIGFPRKPPQSAHPIRLCMLSLSNLSFRSYETLLRCLTYHCTEKIMYDGIQWPEGPGSVVLPPAGHLLSQLCSHAPKKAFIWQPNSTLPILWSLITTQFPSSPTARLLYISDEQISTVMAIVHLFSDGYNGWLECLEMPQLGLRVATQIGDANPADGHRFLFMPYDSLQV
ncbi:hypothetical protein PHLGIDRAFT_13437 [Phlebiopsis gigantea 11061_1 CR5-6]|uniref:F-box domain-containing protein n=1 Tax=Phlebiopsis gigantea (strain 11061_1 CR5-6) TaxID=745531 RepID=A0A0C3NPJ3_PHLG1|nr:hypothetical protein PHLGIDRAFT_13437 [Phlebiopsis gigantea 11061_1 CR5-6]